MLDPRPSRYTHTSDVWGSSCLRQVVREDSSSHDELLIGLQTSSMAEIATRSILRLVHT